jgi:hypothetical protein
MTSLVVMLLGASLAVVYSHRPIFDSIRKLFIPFAFVLILSLTFAVMVFAVKINCSNRTLDFSNDSAAEEYIAGYADEIPIKNRDLSGSGLGNEVRQAINRHCAVCEMTFLYINHGIFNFEKVLSTRNRGDAVLLVFARNWAVSLGLAEPLQTCKRVYGSGGVTLMGAAYHDYGLAGMLLTAVAHGLLFVFSVWLMHRSNLSAVLGIIGYVASGLITGFSLLFVAPTTIAFPFVIYALLATFVVVAIIQHCRKGSPRECSHVVPESVKLDPP